MDFSRFPMLILRNEYCAFYTTILSCNEDESGNPALLLSPNTHKRVLVEIHS